jgi:hypothetical protein
MDRSHIYKLPDSIWSVGQMANRFTNWLNNQLATQADTTGQ